jgi:plastocyanin
MAALLDRRRVLVTGSSFALASLAGCGPAFDAGDPALGTTVVGMSTTRFLPDAVTIAVGETVEWRNTSIASHTVTADPGRAEDPDRVRVPEGAEPFHSGRIEPGGIYRRRFDVAGTYVYFCVPHEDRGMWGTVIVRPGGAA